MNSDDQGHRTQEGLPGCSASTLQMWCHSGPQVKPLPRQFIMHQSGCLFFSRRVSTTAVGGVVPDFPSVWVCLCTIGDEQPCLWDEGSHWAGRRKNAELDTKAEPTPPSTAPSLHTHPPFSTPHNPQLHAPATTTATRSRRKPRIYVWMTHRRACVRSRPAGNDRGRWFAACVPRAAPYMVALNDKRPGEK